MNEQPTDDKNKQRKYSIRVLLLSSYIKSRLVDLQLIENNIFNHKFDSDSNSNLLINANSDYFISEKIAGELILSEKIVRANQKNKFFTQICTYLNNPTKETKLEKVCWADYIVKNSLLKRNAKLWIPEENQLWLKIIKKIHNQIAVGHLNAKKTIKLVQ